jgi:hypothetical protein
MHGARRFPAFPIVFLGSSGQESNFHLDVGHFFWHPLYNIVHGVTSPNTAHCAAVARFSTYFNRYKTKSLLLLIVPRTIATPSYMCVATCLGAVLVLL